MESITIQAAEQFRNNMEDRSPTKPEVMSRVEETQDEGEEEEDIWPKVMSGVEETQDGGEEEEDCWTMESITIQAAEQFWNNMEDRRPLQPEVKTQDRGVAVVHYHKLLQLELEMLHITQRLMELNGTGRGLLLQKRVNEERKRKEREVWGAAEKIKTETQELQQDTTSQSDPKVTHTAGFIQKMSEEMLKQKERLSDNKMSVKETCREVKIVLQQITDLVEDTLQSLSEDAKLKLESLIKIFYKMTASMWKLMFCALLLYKLREVLDLLKSDSYNISLSRGGLKYAFKMASMLALWLSHDVETNPGPEFNLRDCIEKLVRLFSETLKNDLEIGGTIWSDKVAKAAYDAGFSNNCHWKNPSGKNKDSLPDLIERAEELGRVLKDRNCLPRDLAPFTVDLDQRETQDRLRQHLKTENYRAAVDTLMCEPDFTSSTTEAIGRLTQLLQEKMSNVTGHHTARPPPVTTTHSEFSQLADSQSVTNTVCEETNSIISNIVTRYQSKRRQRKKNKNPKTKQIRNVTASELCTATGIPCHDMFTGGTMVEGAETDSSPGGLSNTHCALSTSTPDTTDTPHQDQDIMEAETTGNSDFVRMTSDNIRENEMKSTPGTSGTDSSHASVAEHVMMSDSNYFDETNVNNDSDVPNQEGRRNVDLVSQSSRNTPDPPNDISFQDFIYFLESFIDERRRNVELVSPSARNTCVVNVGVEMPGDIQGYINLTLVKLSSFLYNCKQGNDVNAAVTDTDTEMNDVPLQTDTADCALPASIGNDPYSVMTGDYRNTSSSDASNPDNSPDDEAQQDAADEGCEDEVAQTSQPSHEAVVTTENNHMDQQSTATDRSCYEHVRMSDSYSFDETNVNNDSEVPKQEGQRNVDLVSQSPRISCDVNGGVEMQGDILGHISLKPDTSDETFSADLSSGLFNFMQGNDVKTAVTDTDTEMNDVPLPTDTADCALPANIGNNPFSVMTGDDRNTSSSDASNPDNSPDDETQQDEADEGCEDEETDTSQPSHEAAVPTENNQLDQPSTATDRSCYEHVMMSDGDSFDESNVNNDSEVPSQEGQRNVLLVLPSARNSSDVNDGVEMTLNQVHLGESDTSLGSISASVGVTEEAGRRKRKRRHQHPPTKKKRQ